MDAIWNFIVSLFGYVMQFCYSISFGNYALALLFYALFFKLLLLPFGLKQQKSQVKMAALRPKIAVIERKYKGKTDRDSLQKKQMEIMELQQKEGVSPFSGCLQMLIQLPIIFALYDIIRRPLTFISGIGDKVAELASRLGMSDFNPDDHYAEINVLNKFLQSPNASAVELVGDAAMPNLSIFGINFGETPNFTTPSWALLVPFLVFGAQFLSMFIMQKLSGSANAMSQTPEAKTSAMIMMLTMPLMTLFFAFQFPAAIGIYWIYQSILGLGQSFILSRVMPLPTFTDEEIRAIEKAEKERQKEAIRAAKANKTRSAIHAIDDDEDDDVVLPPIRSRYGEDDGVDEPTPPPAPAKRETNLNGMASNVSKGAVKQNTNKSKKHNKKK